MNTKVCNSCKIEKKLSEFSKDKSQKDGHQKKCKQCYSEYRKDNIEKLSLQKKEYWKENRDSLLKSKKQYREENKEKIKESSSLYYILNKEKIKLSRQIRKDIVNASNAKYRAAKNNATPNWLTTEQLLEIKKFYILANNLELESSIKYHVDHIIPLNGENVCGLHVPWNLQVIEATENLLKSNKLLEEFENAIC